MGTEQIIIECLKILISWPVAIIVILILLRKEIPAMTADLAKRLKTVEVGGQKFEFFDDLEKQSRVTEVIENIQRENPELLMKSFENAGIKENEYKEFRSNIRNRVIQVQKFLQELGYDLGDTGIDGVTGPKTKSAVKQFQNDYGLTPDGIIGSQTLGMINQIRIKRANK
jgi:murein L,D-transpeptidase YcbB/YkuD